MARKGHTDRGLFLRTLPSGVKAWYVRLYHHGQDKKFGSFRTKTEARIFREKAVTEQREGKFFPERHTRARTRETIADAIERYRPFQQLKKNVRKEQCFAAFGGKHLQGLPLSRITVAQLEAARKLLLREKSNATCNRYVAWLRHLLNRELKLGTIRTNPAATLTRFPEEPAPTHQYTPQQEQRLYRHLGDQADWVRLAILTGMRQREQFGLRKEWIQWEHGIIQIPTSKAGRPRVIMLQAEALAILQTQCQRHPKSPFVFPSPRFPQKQPMDPGAWYRNVFRPACHAAGLPSTLKWHTLRHTFGSRLAAKGASEKQIQALGGWSSTQATNRYIHFVRDDLRQVAERLAKMEPEHKPEHKKLRQKKINKINELA